MKQLFRIKSFNFQSLANDLSAKKVENIVLNTGEILRVDKYDLEKHRIYLENRQSFDLMIFINNIVEYSVFKIVEDEECLSYKRKESFSIYRLANGKPGKYFTIKEFLQIYKNSKKRKSSNAVCKKTLDDGYVYECDSQEERKALNRLIREKCFKRLRGQTPCIKYYFKNKYHEYYPDFFFLTNTKKIVVMEIKQIAMMNSPENLAKYKALGKYCKANGYLYIMCDSSFTPFNTLAGKSISKRVEDAIDDAIFSKGYFGYEDYLELINGLTKSKIKWYRKSIGIYVSTYSNVFMRGNLEHNIKKLKIEIKE